MFDSSVSGRLPSECQKYRHAVGTARQEAGPEHDVGLAGLQRLEHRAVVGRVVLEVGILDDHVLGRAAAKPCAQGGALAEVAPRAG